MIIIAHTAIKLKWIFTVDKLCQNNVKNKIYYHKYNHFHKLTQKGKITQCTSNKNNKGVCQQSEIAAIQQTISIIQL